MIRSKEEVAKAIMDGSFEQELSDLQIRANKTFNAIIDKRKARWSNRSLSDKVFDWLTGNTL